MKTLKTLTLVLFLGLTLSACNLGVGPKKQMESAVNDISKQEEAAQMSPTPTLSADSSLDNIESDLKSTTILEEDFSDLDN